MGYEFDYSKLKGRITEKFGTQSNFAKAVKRTDTYVSMVLNGKTYLDQTEIEKWSAVRCRERSRHSYFSTISSNTRASQRMKQCSLSELDGLQAGFMT